MENTTFFACTCGGRNRDCDHCAGFGIIFGAERAPSPIPVHARPKHSTEPLARPHARKIKTKPKDQDVRDVNAPKARDILHQALKYGAPELVTSTSYCRIAFAVIVLLQRARRPYRAEDVKLFKASIELVKAVPPNWNAFGLKHSTPARLAETLQLAIENSSQ